MKYKLLFCVLFALIFPAVIFSQPSNAGNFSSLKNAVILVIRHAEPDDGYGLSEAGGARAKAYVNYFKNFTIDGQSLKLDYLFAAKDSSQSHRCRLTIEPTGQELGLSVDSRFSNKHFLELADEIESQPYGRAILICWHHGKIPQLLRALGADPKRLFPHGKWPDDVFGWLIQLRYDENGRLFESKRIRENLSSDSRKRDPAMPRLNLSQYPQP